MKYFLGEIYITHRKTFFGSIPLSHLVTTELIEADNWKAAKEKFNLYIEERYAPKLKKFKYVSFVSIPI